MVTVLYDYFGLPASRLAPRLRDVVRLDVARFVGAKRFTNVG
jgi:hypothetical protein